MKFHELFRFYIRLGMASLIGSVGFGGVSPAVAAVRAAPHAWAICILGSICNIWGENVLDVFAPKAQGYAPSGSLIADASGALYGTTGSGGSADSGTVFKLTPRGSGWTRSVLYSFSGRGDGGLPTAGVIADARGALYGTASRGGSLKCDFGGGIVFKLSPPLPGTSTWTETVLHTFTLNGGDGAGPQGSLIADTYGALYGTTAYGGSGCTFTSACGTVFKLTPPQRGQRGWTENILHTFSGTRGDGAYPLSGLTADASGALYGTTEEGGFTHDARCYSVDGCGTVYKVTPPRLGAMTWTTTVLHAFSSLPPESSIYPVARPVLFGGSLYGTVQGLAYKLTPPQSGQGAWSETTIVSFDYNSLGSGSDLIVDGQGNLFGTAYAGGAYTYGTVFELMPPRFDRPAWTGHVLHAFSDVNGDGASPEGGLVADHSGNLYGTTSFGGNTIRDGTSKNCNCLGVQAVGCGTVFKLQPYPRFQCFHASYRCFAMTGARL